MVELLAMSTVLGVVAEKVLSVLADKCTGELQRKLRGDNTRKAFKLALGEAIQRYSTLGARLELARPLLAKDGFLMQEPVVGELGQIVRFDRVPDPKLIGQLWEAALEFRPPEWWNSASEAELLLRYLEEQLRGTEAFLPVFVAKDIRAIVASKEESSERLSGVVTRLDGLRALLEARLGDLAKAFAQVSGGIQEHIREDFAGHIEEKTRGFVGRRWVFDAVERFMDENPRGYFFVFGDPGIGKSALAAQLIKENGYVHHFNVRVEGITKASMFLKNVCAQLIAKYGLEYAALSPDAGSDAGFLNQILREVSDRLGPDERCVIVVDALDEVDMTGIPVGANPLYMPLMLPEGVYVVATARLGEDERYVPRVDCEQGRLEIDHDSRDNVSDVEDFLRAATVRPGIQAYMVARGVEPREFVETLRNKSEKNFMYLRHVLPEIERGVYRDLKLETIPVGLRNYYEDHWRRMRGQDEDAWFEYKLPVIVALSVAHRSISVDLISDFANVSQRRRVRSVLNEWAQFLHWEELEHEGILRRGYRLYHASFFDFVASKQEVAAERVDLKAMHAQITDNLWEELLESE